MMKKERYIDLMATVLSAYTDEHIRAYFDRVQTEGLTEHGFPRLCANLGILISHGVRTDLTPLFLDMMDFCCHEIPRVKAANDFSVREIVFCIMECEAAHTVSRGKIAEWKTALSSIEPTRCYNRFALTPEDDVRNWALFTALSEYMRGYIGLPVSEAFIETQIASQMKFFDENGMYMDHMGTDDHQPIVYDLVPRGLFSILLKFGYRGKYRDEIDEMLRKAGLLTLRMQSVTGEIPYGGRSNQFLHNEAWLALILEFEASRYDRTGDTALAASFRSGVERAISNVESHLAKRPIYHVKNRFPTETGYGCENYAYFDKYMITTASFLYAAYLMHEDGAVEPPTEQPADAFVLSEHFHKLFLRCGAYFLEFDTNADPQYDACGLGRVHRAGAPSAICLSVPCPEKPKYRIGDEPHVPLSLCPGVRSGDAWSFVSNGEARTTLLSMEYGTDTATISLSHELHDTRVTETCTVTSDGVRVELCGDGRLGYTLPALHFDGNTEAVVTQSASALEIRYEGFLCRYETSGTISDTGRLSYNRNGVYRVFLAEGDERLTLRILIERENV